MCARLGASLLILLLYGGVARAEPVLGATQATAAQAAFLCPAGSPPNAAAISRQDLVWGYHRRFRPFRRLVRNQANVQRLFRDTCKLQPFVGESISCPADFGIFYHVDFLRRGRSILRITADASGCDSLQRGASIIGTGRAYRIWVEPVESPKKFPWMYSARAWVVDLAAALGVPIRALSPQAR